MSDFLADIDWSRWLESVWTTTARVALVLAVIYVVVRLLRRLFAPAIRATVMSRMAGEPQYEVDKRIDTLTGVANTTLSAVAITIALLSVLPSFGINVQALIAGAGIAGIAIGFGTQSLVRDIVGGVFILVENQYGQGDVVHLAGVEGVVEDVNLRRTVLRDQDGTVHNIPHGAIAVASNKTRLISRVNLVVTVQHGADLNAVFDAVDRTGQQLAQDPEWEAAVTSPPKALGVEDLRPAGIDVRILGETLPNRQWEVMREMRLRLTKTFDAAGIKLAVG